MSYAQLKRSSAVFRRVGLLLHTPSRFNPPEGRLGILSSAPVCCALRKLVKLREQSCRASFAISPRPRRFRCQLLRAHQPKDLSLARARFLQGGERPGKLLVNRLRQNDNNQLPRGKNLASLGSEYGIIAACPDKWNMQFPDSPDTFNSEQGAGAPRYFAPPVVAAGPRHVQMFGPSYCVDFALEHLPAVTRGSSTGSVPLGPLFARDKTKERRSHGGILTRLLKSNPTQSRAKVMSTAPS